jgi:hypothetical protein
MRTHSRWVTTSARATPGDSPPYHIHTKDAPQGTAAAAAPAQLLARMVSKVRAGTAWRVIRRCRAAWRLRPPCSTQYRGQTAEVNNKACGREAGRQLLARWDAGLQLLQHSNNRLAGATAGHASHRRAYHKEYSVYCSCSCRRRAAACPCCCCFRTAAIVAPRHGSVALRVLLKRCSAHNETIKRSKKRSA